MPIIKYFNTLGLRRVLFATACRKLVPLLKRVHGKLFPSICILLTEKKILWIHSNYKNTRINYNIYYIHFNQISVRYIVKRYNFSRVIYLAKCRFQKLPITPALFLNFSKNDIKKKTKKPGFRLNTKKSNRYLNFCDQKMTIQARQIP